MPYVNSISFPSFENFCTFQDIYKILKNCYEIPKKLEQHENSFIKYNGTSSLQVDNHILEACRDATSRTLHICLPFSNQKSARC